MKRIIAQTRKELTQFSRDRLTVVLALVLPLIQMWLIGTCVSLTVTDLPVVVQDWDQSPTSRRYVDTIRSSLTFRIVALPVTEGAEYRVSGEGGEGTMSFVVLPSVSEEPEDLAAQLIEKGCTRQLEILSAAMMVAEG